MRVSCSISVSCVYVYDVSWMYHVAMCVMSVSCYDVNVE